MAPILLVLEEFQFILKIGGMKARKGIKGHFFDRFNERKILERCKRLLKRFDDGFDLNAI